APFEVHPQAFHSFFQVVHGTGIRKAQVAFRAEIAAGGDGDARSFQDVQGEAVGVVVVRPRVGEDVKGARRGGGDLQAYGAKAFQQEAPPLVVRLHHLLHVRRAFLQRGDARPLGEGGGAYEQVLLQLEDGPLKSGRRDDVAEAPS